MRIVMRLPTYFWNTVMVLEQGNVRVLPTVIRLLSLRSVSREADEDNPFSP